MAAPGRARWLSAGLAAALVAAPQPVVAAPSKADRALLDKVSKLAAEAQTRFETADFAGAIELWTQAYAALPAEPAYEKRRNGLVYLIAQASIEAYALDPQHVYLRKAERLFEQYLTTIKDRDTIDKVQASLAELREKIGAAEEKEAAAEQAAAAREAEAEKARRAEQQRAEARRKAAEHDARAARKLTIVGGGLAGLGVVGLGVMAYGLASGRRIDRDGDAARADGVTDLDLYRALIADGVVANRIAIASGAVGGALLAAGLALVGAGTARKQRARRELLAGPIRLRGGAGLLIQVRF